MKKRLIAIAIILLLIVCIPAAPAAHASVTNMLQNGSFETSGANWLLPWTFNAKVGTSASIAQSSTWAADGTHSAKVTIAATTGSQWDIQFFQPVSISAGQPYLLSFSAKSSKNRTLGVLLAQSTAPWAQYTPVQTFNLTSSARVFTVSFTPSTTDTNAWLLFNLGASSTSLWLDNVSLSASGMLPPPGYSTSIFDDQFAGTALDSTKWIPQMADAQYGIWQDNGKLPSPYSAVSNDGGYNAEYGDPAMLSVSNGLDLNAQRSSQFSFYSWKAGYITTHGKFTFNHGYVQVKAKLPDSTSGAWAGIWFLDGGGEIDLNESGNTACGAAAVNRCMSSNLHSAGNSQHSVDTGVDLTAGYHIYGMEYKPGVSITMYLDGVQVAQYSSNIPTGSYTMLITETVAQNTSPWHTVADANTPSPLPAYSIAEVQVWQ